jgi:hypothetical protein
MYGGKRVTSVERIESMSIIEGAGVAAYCTIRGGISKDLSTYDTKLTQELRGKGHTGLLSELAILRKLCGDRL